MPRSESARRSRAVTLLRRVVPPALLVLVLGACAEVTGTGDPSVAATVQGETISVTDLRAEADGAGPPADDPAADDPEVQQEVEAQALSQMILRRLLEEGADDLGVSLTSEDVAEEREEIVEQLGGEEALGDTLGQLGLSEDEFEEQVELLALESAIAEVLVDDEELEGLRSARHILVEEEDEADEALERIDEGEDFAEVAEDVSIDEGSAVQGGDLGTIAPGETIEEFEDALGDLEEGELSDPVETQFGWHVIERLEDPADGEQGDEARAQIEQSAVAEWITQRAEEASVTVNPRFGVWRTDPQPQVMPISGLDRSSDLERPSAADGDAEE